MTVKHHPDCSTVADISEYQHMWPFSRSTFAPTFAQWNSAPDIDELAANRQRLADRHIRSLGSATRKAFAQGVYPSQSHAFADAARPFIPRLEQHFAALGIPAKVDLGLYHLDRIVLFATLAADPGPRLATFPALFEGFEIKYDWSSASPTRST